MVSERQQSIVLQDTMAFAECTRQVILEVSERLTPHRVDDDLVQLGGLLGCKRRNRPSQRRIQPGVIEVRQLCVIDIPCVRGIGNYLGYCFRLKSLDAQDVPQTLSVSNVYQLPFGQGQRYMNKGGVVDKLVGGWQLTDIIRVQSALPFAFQASCNVPSQFAMGCIPGLLSGANPFAQSKGSFNPSQPLLNKAAFENGSTGGVFSFYGGQGPRVSNLRGFGFHNWDVSLQKTTSITERVRFEIRAQFFNIWNWHIFSQGTTWGQGGAFDTNLSSPTFGMITGNVTNPRNIQLGGKFVF